MIDRDCLVVWQPQSQSVMMAHLIHVALDCLKHARIAIGGPAHEGTNISPLLWWLLQYLCE